MARGNPNPSPATRFGAGQPSNNGGKTAEQKRLDYETAEMAARIRNKLISVIMDKMGEGADALELLSPDTLRLIKDSEDRAHGTPKQAVDHTSSDGSMTPQIPASQRIIDRINAIAERSPETGEPDA